MAGIDDLKIQTVDNMVAYGWIGKHLIEGIYLPVGGNMHWHVASVIGFQKEKDSQKKNKALRQQHQQGKDKQELHQYWQD